ncbi:MAG: carbamoyltransferase [Cellvibrionaceae bacterium]
MVILGLNYYFHDSSACLVIDGKLIVALEEERFSRNKHTGDFPRNAIDECLKFAKISYNDIDHIAVSIKPTLDWQKKVLYGLKNILNSKPFIKHELFNGRLKQKGFWNWYNDKFKSVAVGPRIEFVEHHLSHAAGSFFVSPYDEAAILALDGSGEWACGWTGFGKGNDIQCFEETYFPHSLGSFYEAVTEFCGFRPNYDEGKTMGLAPLGDASIFYDRVSDIVSINAENKITLDLSYFNFQFWGYKRCSEKFHDVFGAPRSKDSDFAKHHYDVAAAFQKVLEETALKIARNLKEKTGARFLVIAGGVSLNSVMNGRLLREAGFDDVYIMPAAGDNGTSIGAAYYLYNGILKKDRNFIHDNPYVGNEYDNDFIEVLLKQFQLKYEYCDDIALAASELLFNGKIIGWFQGRMEIGPRALGARSILANPAIRDMKDKINAQVKYREAYRPFAPSSTVEGAKLFFDINVEAPFMLKVCDVLPDKREVIPAVTHVDGSARLQTVKKETNPLYHALISKLAEKTGVPVVLNTSFNIQGEPVVESPRDAIRCFFSTGLDALVLGNYVVYKK